MDLGNAIVKAIRPAENADGLYNPKHLASALLPVFRMALEISTGIYKASRMLTIYRGQ